MCLIGQYKCANGNCIDSAKVCDKFDDCKDASDENGCNKDSGIDCSVNNGGCEQNCTNLPQGGYYCQCRSGFIVSQEDRKSCADVDECSSWATNLCPQKCINVKGSYKCRCYNDFFIFNSNKRECRAEGKKLVLLFGAGAEIRQFIPQAKHFEYADVVLSGRRIQALDVDPDRKLLYWTDSSQKTIKRALIPDNPEEMGHPQDLKVTGIRQPSGLAFDWVAKVLYWTDTQKGVIYAATDDGRYRKTLVSGKQFKPMAIAVNPKLGWMYWTDCFPKHPRIEAAWMNGQNRTVLVDTRLGNPTGLTIDYYMNDRLYWCDNKENIIESMNPDGSDRVVVVRAGLNHPFSIDVFESQLYWASVDEGEITNMDKFGRGVNRTVQSGLIMPRAIRVYHQFKYDMSIKNRCANKGCWPLCVLVPDGAQCICPDHADFLPGSPKVCDSPHEPEMPQPQSCICEHGGQCVPDTSGDNQVFCKCVSGYYGSVCQYGQAYAARKDVVAIVVPVCIVFLLIVLAVALFLYLRRRNGKSVSSGSVGEFRVGHTGVVAFHGDNNIDLTYDAPPGEPMESLQSEMNTNNGNHPTNFSNPMYESYTDPDVATTTTPSPPPIEMTLTESVLPSTSVDVAPSDSEPATSSKKMAGFSPTSIDTDKDTQALVMEDDDE